LSGEEGHGIGVEGDEGAGSEPRAFVGDQAVGEVAACVADREACGDGLAIDDDIG
jgi:hypothetical protein